MKKLSDLIIITNQGGPMEELIVDFSECNIGDSIENDTEKFLPWINANATKRIDAGDILIIITSAFNQRANQVNAENISEYQVETKAVFDFVPKLKNEEPAKTEENFKTRLFDERAQLAERIGKLEAFIQSDKSNEIDRIQLQAMKTYLHILDERICRL